MCEDIVLLLMGKSQSVVISWTEGTLASICLCAVVIPWQEAIVNFLEDIEERTTKRQNGFESFLSIFPLS